MRAKSCFPPPPSSSSSPPLFPPPFHLISPIELMDWPLRRRISFHALPLPPISRGEAKNSSEKGGFSYLQKEGRRKGCTPKFKEEKMSETELIILVHTTSHTLSTPGKHNKDCTAAHIKISLFRPSSQAVAPTPQKQLPKVGGRSRWTKCVRRGRGELMKLFIPSFSLFLLLPPSPQDRGESKFCVKKDGRVTFLPSLETFPPLFAGARGGENVSLSFSTVFAERMPPLSASYLGVRRRGESKHISHRNIYAHFSGRDFGVSAKTFSSSPQVGERAGGRERESFPDPPSPPPKEAFRPRPPAPPICEFERSFGLLLLLFPPFLMTLPSIPSSSSFSSSHFAGC